MLNDIETAPSTGIGAQPAFHVEDFRGKVDFFMGPAACYNDWPADDIREFGRSQLDIVENELKIAKALLLASDVNSAVVYTRGIKTDATTEPVIIIGIDGTFKYPADAMYRSCRIHIHRGVWLADSFPPVGKRSWSATVPSSGKPISVLCTDDGKVSESFTVGAVMFGYPPGTAAAPTSAEQNSAEEPESIYVLTCGRSLSANPFSIGTSNDRNGNRNLQLIFPASPSLVAKEIAQRAILRTQNEMKKWENDIQDARTSLINLARVNGLDPCLDITTDDGVLPLSLQGQDLSTKKVSYAWSDYQWTRAYKPTVEKRTSAEAWQLRYITHPREMKTIGYVRAAELGQIRTHSLTTPVSQLSTSVPPPSKFVPPIPDSTSPSLAVARLPCSDSPVLTYLDAALFEITDPHVIYHLKEANSPFLSNYGKLEDNMEVFMSSWAAPEHAKSSVDSRGFFVSKIKGEGLHVLDHGRAMVLGEEAQAKDEFPDSGGASGAVVYAGGAGPDDLRRPVALCAGVFSLLVTEECIGLILPLSDIVPHLEAAVHQRLSFSRNM